MSSTSVHEKFSSNWGFVLAAIGGAVGLGNIWRFPFMAGENGGGAFILLYFLFVLAFGIPAVIAMIVIGRRGGLSPVGSTRVLALAEGHSANWRFLGWLALTVAFLALSFFSMVSGWILVYLYKALMGEFSAISPQASLLMFSAVRSNTGGMMFWHGLFMVFTMFIVARGVRAGIEAMVRWMMPALFLILLSLVIYGALRADFSTAVAFMFRPDFAKIDRNVVLLAMGQAFFSLSVGGGGIITYGAYLARSASIPRMAAMIAAANVSVDLLAGLAIFPLVFAYGLTAAAGPGLMFETLPIAFGQMPGGRLVGILFFCLLFLAALSTSISMLESVVSRLVEVRGASRRRMTMLAGGMAWFIGLGSVFSFNIWADFKPLAFIPVFRDATVFRIIDFFTVNILVMVSACLITIFVGRVMSRHATQDELAQGNTVFYRTWRFIMRYPAPLAIVIVFILGLAG